MINSFRYFLARVSRQIQEFEIQVVEIESAGDKGIDQGLINDLVNRLSKGEGVQNQDFFRSQIGLGRGRSRCRTEVRGVLGPGRFESEPGHGPER